MLLVTAVAMLVSQAEVPAVACQPGATSAPRVQGFSPATLVIGDEEATPLFRVRSATLTADLSLAVANGGTSEILVFGPDGSLRRNLGGAGGGPAEFGRLGTASWMRGDRVAVTDFGGWKVVVMDVEQGFVASVPIRDLRPSRIQAVRPLPDGRWLVTSTTDGAPPPGGGRFRGELAVSVHAANGDLERRVLTLPGVDWWDFMDPSGGGSRGLPVFPKMTRVVVDRTGCLWVNTGADLEVLVYDLEGRVRGTVALPEELGRPVTRDEWSARIDAHVEQTLDPDWQPRIRRVYEAIPFDPIRPAMSGMRIDDEGRLWVAPEHGPDEDVEGWWVYAGSGSEPDWVPAPAPSGARRILDVRYGHIVLLHVSELGVETISVRELL